MVNGPEVWTRLGWMMNWRWIDSWMAVIRCFTCLLTCISEKFWKIYNPTNDRVTCAACCRHPSV